MLFRSIAARMLAIVTFVLVASAAASAKSGVSVLTYHNNYQRWGWNAQETILTPSALSSTSSKFGVIATVNVDDVMFAQPLIVPQLAISCPAGQTIVTCNTGALGVHDIVFLATRSNSVYAIDANTGAILLKRHFGPAATGGGIRGTPVIDPAKGILYVIAHIGNAGSPIYRLYALDIKTLTDAIAPYTITGANTSEPLTNGVKFSFNSAEARQRPGLLLLNGKLYAAFSGAESNTAPGSLSRGWLMGWNASDLTPLTPLLTNQEATAANSFFLSSIWMSGAGVASDGKNLYFVTGNSDPSGLSYDPVNNIEESVVKVTPELKVSSVFTPYTYANMDRNDADFGSGGVMILPGTPPLAVAAGKVGKMYLLNGDSLGGYTPGGPDNVLDNHLIGGCWCTPSFYTNSKGQFVVSSGGRKLMTWKLNPGTSTSNPTLVWTATAELPASLQDPGFFTSVSSNGPNSAVIWALGTPTDATGALTLYAYDGLAFQGKLNLLGQYPAGTWNPNYGRNMTSVPVVANGKVYVASGNGSTFSGILTILGMVP